MAIWLLLGAQETAAMEVTMSETMAVLSLLRRLLAMGEVIRQTVAVVTVKAMAVVETRTVAAMFAWLAGSR